MATSKRIRVEKITYNWRQVNDGEIAGEDYDYFELGKNGVSEIRQEGSDKRMASVYFDDGSIVEINNVNTVYWKSYEP